MSGSGSSGLRTWSKSLHPCIRKCSSQNFIILAISFFVKYMGGHVQSPTLCDSWTWSCRERKRCWREQDLAVRATVLPPDISSWVSEGPSRASERPSRASTSPSRASEGPSRALESLWQGSVDGQLWTFPRVAFSHLLSGSGWIMPCLLSGRIIGHHSFLDCLVRSLCIE